MDTADGYVIDVDYVPGFYPRVAPVALWHVAALNRLTPPGTAGGFSYLELGCGLGRSLTTLAAANPEGRLVGVDINAHHTAAIEAEVAPAGLDNVRAITFLVSCNALPGWAHLQPIKGILRQYAALRTGDSRQGVRDGLAYRVFIRDKKAKYFEDNPRAAAHVDALVKQNISYLAHEYLNEHWTSFYFADVAAAFKGAGLQFAGSLPLYTNFWDLCVLPEFHELFRTTNEWLVAEAHKDFCANTAFRWDIYERAPRPLTAAEDRLRETDDTYYGLTRADLTLPYRANLGVITSTVQGPMYQGLIDALRGGSRRLSELLPLLATADRKPDEIIRAADAGVAIGMFDVSGRSIPTPPFEAPHAIRIPSSFNRTTLASGSLGGRPVAVASQRLRTGVQLGDLEAAMPLELADGGREGLAGRVGQWLTASGHNLQQDSNPATDSATRDRLVEQVADSFIKTRNPPFGGGRRRSRRRRAGLNLPTPARLPMMTSGTLLCSSFWRKAFTSTFPFVA